MTALYSLPHTRPPDDTVQNLSITNPQPAGSSHTAGDSW